MKARYKVILIAVVGLLAVFALVGCGSSSSKSSTSSSAATSSGTSSSATTSTTTTQTAKTEYTYNEPFDFDGLSITFGSELKQTTLDNQFSEHNGATVVGVPIAVTNNSSESKGLNMFYYKIFGVDGTEQDNISSYFDDDVAFAGDMRSGATKQSYLYILYTGAGDYYIEFNNYADKVTVKLPINLG